ncbi:nitrite reductase small subunit NirD [Candidatus Woesearchaeota archaeon]|nr:nitrite reductase small subunit NirD [Candidatus Woesearchaeota archaeon]
MPQKIKVANVNEIPEGSSKIVEAAGKEIAVFNIKGKFFAISNICAHQGGSLGEGFVAGETVTCPLHAWEYDLETGESQTQPGAKVPAYKVIVENDGVFVEI